VFSKSLIEQKNFKSGFKNGDSLMRTVCGSSSRQTVLKTNRIISERHSLPDLVFSADTVHVHAFNIR